MLAAAPPAAEAFVPGGMVRTTQVQLPAVAHELAVLAAPAGLQGFPLHRQALKILEMWMKDAEAAAAAALGSNDTDKELAMGDTLHLLQVMRNDISTGSTVLALASGGWRRDVHAIAHVTPRNVSFIAGNSTTETVYIKFLAARPKAGRPRGAGAELVRRIVDWAASTGRLVTLHASNGPLAQQYFMSLGFEPTGGSPPLIYKGGTMAAQLPAELGLCMVQLK